jgi:type IV secretion system protein VirB11
MTDKTAILNCALAPFKPFLAEDRATAVVVNKPGEVFTIIDDVPTRYEAPDLTFQACVEFLNAVATYSNQVICDSKPLFTATLPNGEVVTVVKPPVVENGTMTIEIDLTMQPRS